MLTRAVCDYLAVRRTAGFALSVDAGLLRDFARFAGDRAQTHVRQQAAIEWAAQAPSPAQRERRLGMVRRLAVYLRAEDSVHERVPQNVFAHRRTRPLPYLLSDRELQQLLAATARLRPRGSLRPLTYCTLFGLLAATGLRISEALHLALDDIDADGLVIRQTKFRKSRLVPMHETTAAALDRYVAQRRAVAGGDAHVFVAATGRPLTYPMVNGTFHFLLRFVELQATLGQRTPRIHDMRHRFAVRVDRIAPVVRIMRSRLGPLGALRLAAPCAASHNQTLHITAPLSTESHEPRFLARTAFQSGKAASAKPGPHTEKPAVEVGEEFLPRVSEEADRKRLVIDRAEARSRASARAID